MKASNSNVTSPPCGTTSAASRPVGTFLEDRVLTPLVNLLRRGASPRQLAWSLAVGVAIGINPILGSTTLLCLLVAFVLRLNLIASQIANHLLFPLQLALVVVYLKGGELLFHTGPLPMAGNAFVHAVRHREWSTAHELWTWEWHALVVWLLAAAVLTPVLARAFCPLLTRLHQRLHREAATQ
jgi:uncharacterized protein (DUF2062 family)